MPCKTCLQAHVDKESLDKPVHPYSLIKAYTVSILQNVYMERKDPDDTLGMGRMI